MSEVTLSILVPLPVFRDEIIGAETLAPRPATLEGKTVGLVPNWRPSAFDLLQAVGEDAGPRLQQLAEMPVDVLLAAVDLLAAVGSSRK